MVPPPPLMVRLWDRPEPRRPFLQVPEPGSKSEFFVHPSIRCCSFLLFAFYFLVHHSVLKLTQDGGPCDFWLWEDQYVFFITDVGINLLIEAAGGGSNVMFGIGRAMEDVRIAARNTMMICLAMLFVVLAKSAGGQY